MATDRMGNVAIVVPYGSDKALNHALDDHPGKKGFSKDLWRTACGRDASEWVRLDDQNISKFMDSAYTCKRCLNIII